MRAPTSLCWLMSGQDNKRLQCVFRNPERDLQLPTGSQHPPKLKAEMGTSSILVFRRMDFELAQRFKGVDWVLCVDLKVKGKRKLSEKLWYFSGAFSDLIEPKTVS